MRTAGRVRGALELVGVATAVVLVDLAAVTAVDDAALDLLASARRRAAQEGWTLEVTGAPAREPAAQPVALPPSRTMVTNRMSNPARA